MLSRNLRTTTLDVPFNRTGQGSPAPRALALALLALLGGPVAAGNFVYEGRLEDHGIPASGRYDFQLTPYAGNSVKQSMTAPLNFYGVEVRDGRFRIDFDTPVALGTDVWLELAIRDGGASTSFNAIPGRSKAIAAPLIGACWSTTGDSGSNPATNFLGTTDAQPLELRTANARGLRIEPSVETFGSPALPITSNSISGSHANVVDPGVRGAVIAGGGLPEGDSDPDYIFESPNRVTAHYGVVSGGYANRAGGAGAPNLGTLAFVGGGVLNVASGGASVIAGGSDNQASGGTSVIGGGLSNQASGTRSAIGGGEDNVSMGTSATVSGGQLNCAGGNHSWAGGIRAKVRPAASPASGSCAGLGTYPGGEGDFGTFVWADRQSGNFVSSGSNQFAVRAGGGFGLNVAPPVASVEMTIQSSPAGSDFASVWLKQRGQADGILVSAGGGNGGNNAGFFVDHYSGAGQARRMELAADGSVIIRSNVTAENTGVTMAAGGGSFTSLSDRHVKTAIEAIDPTVILDQVVGLPISTWSYIAQGTGIRHIGPMAQDFMAAFEVGETDTGITTIDADGVALAAIQGLNAKLEAERDALAGQVERLSAENAALRSTSADIQSRLERLEARLAQDEGR
jgi:hypothetical protein